MKQISFFIPLLGTLLLSGCAGSGAGHPEQLS